MLINLLKDENKPLEFDSGFYFGKGLFETILVLEKPVFLEEHLERLNQGLRKLSIDIQVNKELILKNIVLSKRELNYTEAQYEEGFKLKLSQLKRDPKSHMVYLKSFNYLDNLLEREKAIKEGFDEVVFLNNESFLTEGSVSNLFVIMEDCILTPAVDCGLLDGIVRSFIIKEFGEKYNIIEGKISLGRLEDCKGMFITNSLLGLMWINSFNGYNLDRSKLYDKIKKNYSLKVT